MSSLYKSRPQLTHEEREGLKLDFLSVSIGTTSYESACPRCGHNKSFGVTKQANKLLYNCHRHKCQVRGVVYISPSTDLREVVPKEVALEDYAYETEPLSAELKEVLYKVYEIDTDIINSQGLKYEPLYHRLMMPMYNILGHEIGMMCKKLPRSSYNGPKTMRYRTVRDPSGLHFPKRDNKTDTVMVVEDAISAIKLCRYASTCALSGTNLSYAQIEFLRQNFESIVLLLDPDAFNKAAQLRMKYGSLFKTFQIGCLPADPKDTQYNILNIKIPDFLGNTYAKESTSKSL